MLFHSIPQGGKIFLPIYFFTLLGAYKYGLKPGLLIAVLSPIVNHFLTGMPPAASLPDILVKSCLLAFAAAFAAKHYQKLSIPLLAGVVLFYQLTGSMFEWIWSGSFYEATQDFRLALPGMLLQLFGVYFIVKYILNK
jgi:thiamine transporter ThiT